MKINTKSKLSELSLPFLEQTLRDCFGYILDAENSSTTIGDLAEKRSLNINYVINRIDKIKKSSQEIVRDLSYFKSCLAAPDAPFQIVDVSIQPLRIKPELQSIRKVHYLDLDALPFQLPKNNLIIVLAKNPYRGFGAAMVLKELGWDSVWVENSYEACLNDLKS